MANTLIKTIVETKTVRLPSSADCSTAVFAALPMLFPGYTVSTYGGQTYVTGPGGDRYRIRPPHSTTCLGGYITVEYEPLGE